MWGKFFSFTVVPLLLKKGHYSKGYSRKVIIWGIATFMNKTILKIQYVVLQLIISRPGLFRFGKER